MKTLIISTSLSPTSNSFKLLKEVSKHFPDAEFVDLRELKINFAHQDETEDITALREKINASDNFILGMAVQNYTVNDSFKAMLDTAFQKDKLNHKLFGIVCAAGSDFSFLATQDPVQMMMNEFHMLAFPHMLFASGKDFDENGIKNEKIPERAKEYAQNFLELGKKLV